MASGRANKGMGDQGTGGHNAGRPDGHLPDESDFTELMDQRQPHNQRGRLAGEHARTEGVVESFERMDPKKRA